MFSEPLAKDKSDDHTFCTLKTRHQLLSMEEDHNVSPWALTCVRTTLTVCSVICPWHTCDLGFGNDGRHGYNELKQERKRMVDALWKAAETHLNNLQLLRHGPDSGSLHLLFLLYRKFFLQILLVF